MSDENADLDALVARLADGDRSVFPAAFRALWSPVSSLCAGMLANEADAADAAQAAMEKIFARASDYDPRRPARPWALAIAAWECRTLRRQRQRRREVGGEHTGDGLAPDAEATVVETELVRAALDALGELSVADRDVLVATYWDEAAGTGAAIRKRRERALERLRRALRRTYGFP